MYTCIKQILKYLANTVDREDVNKDFAKTKGIISLICYPSSYYERNMYYFFSIPFVSLEECSWGFFWKPRLFSGLVRFLHGAVVFGMLYCDLLFYLPLKYGVVFAFSM